MGKEEEFFRETFMVGVRGGKQLPAMLKRRTVESCWSFAMLGEMSH